MSVEQKLKPVRGAGNACPSRDGLPWKAGTRYIGLWFFLGAESGHVCLYVRGLSRSSKLHSWWPHDTGTISYPVGSDYDHRFFSSVA